jgi:hypothetical protein
MNKILKLSAIALLASSTSLMAQSKSFEGASIGLFGSVIGAEVDGKVTDSNNAVSTGSIGKVTPVAGLDASYTFATGSNGFFGIGATYLAGKAEFGLGNADSADNGTSKNFKGEIKDHYSVYIQPGYAVSKDSAVYGKLSYNHADFNVTNAVKQPGNLEGWGAGVGLKTFLNANTFVQVEASYTEYDTLTATRTATGGTGVVTASGTPTIAAGTVTIGYKF